MWPDRGLKGQKVDVWCECRCRYGGCRVTGVLVVRGRDCWMLGVTEGDSVSLVCVCVYVTQ